MKTNHSEVHKTALVIIGIHTERFRTLMTILAAILTVFGVILCVYWNYDENSAGDEFVAIVVGEDYLAFQEQMANFDEKMTYSIINYEGVDLIFSVARGFSEYKECDEYKDVLQRADKAMYENKAEIKKNTTSAGDKPGS